MTIERTYLDHNATAPLRSEAKAAMLSALDLVGNPSSVHTEGRRARAVIEHAREQVAALVGADPAEVVFTSGATEANNWAIRGGWDVLVVGATEHDSVLAPAHAVDPELLEIGCGRDGVVSLAVLSGALGVAPTHGRSLLSLGIANAETGVVQSIADAAAAAHRQGFILHCDAVQAVGRIPVDRAALGVDLMSISAHKIGGPKGVGALILSDEVELPAFVSGGGQERRRRAGTENVAAIAGFGAAAAAAQAGLPLMQSVALMRDELEAGVRAITPEVEVIGSGVSRLPNTSCLAIAGEHAATLLIKLDLAGIAVSAGSACSSGKIGGSHVLAAMGLEPAVAAAAIRVSLGPDTTPAGIAHFHRAWQAIHQGRPGRTTTRRPATTRVASATSA